MMILKSALIITGPPPEHVVDASSKEHVDKGMLSVHNLGRPPQRGGVQPHQVSLFMFTNVIQTNDAYMII